MRALSRTVIVVTGGVEGTVANCLCDPSLITGCHRMRHGSTCLESPSLALPPCEVGGEDLYGLTSLEISHRKRNQGSFKSGNPRFTKEGERKFTTCFHRPVELAVLREAQCERKLEHKTHATR